MSKCVALPCMKVSEAVFADDYFQKSGPGQVRPWVPVLGSGLGPFTTNNFNSLLIKLQGKDFVIITENFIKKKL